MSRTDNASQNDFIDPVDEKRGLHEKESKIAVAGHPIHAMLVAFPIALTMSVLGAICSTGGQVMRSGLLPQAGLRLVPF